MCNARRVQNGLIIGGNGKQIMLVADSHANDAFGHYGVSNLITPNTSDAHTNHYKIKWACVKLLCTPAIHVDLHSYMGLVGTVWGH